MQAAFGDRGGRGHSLQASGHCKSDAKTQKIGSTLGGKIFARYSLPLPAFHTVPLLDMMVEGRGQGEREGERTLQQERNPESEQSIRRLA